MLHLWSDDVPLLGANISDWPFASQIGGGSEINRVETS